MGAVKAVDMLIKDHGDKNSPEGFRKDFADDAPYKSFLQRNSATLDEMLKVFDWKDDDASWVAEYKGERNIDKLVRYRRRIYVELCGWRDFKEDFGRGDVSCLRDIRTPFVTSRSPLLTLRAEIEEGGGK